MKKRFEYKVISTLVYSAFASVVLIAHGLFFDLDYSQLKRLTFLGFTLTAVMVFVGLIILEKIFNLRDDDNTSKISELKRRIVKLEKKN